MNGDAYGKTIPPDRLGPAAALTAAAIFLLGAFILYWPSLRAPFLFDDLYLVFLNKPITALGHWPEMLRHNRPLVIFTYALNYALDGYRPLGYHIFQVVLHGANAFLVFLLASMLLSPPSRPRGPGAAVWLGVAAGGLFLASPLLSMAVVLVSARSELLCAFFYLLGLVLFLRHLEQPGRLGWLAVGAAYLGGILSKEMAVTFPLACLILHGLRRPAELRAALRENWKLYALLGVVTLGLLAKVLQHPWGETVGGSHLPFTRWEYLLTQVNILARFVGVFLLPLPSWLNADWDYPIVRTLLDPRLLISAAFWLAVTAGLWVSWRKRWSAVLFAGPMYLLASAPTSSVVPIADPLMEYRVYVPAIFLALGLAALLGLAADWHRRRETTRRWAPAFAAVLLAGVLLADSLWLRERLAVYRSAEAFWSDAARKSPRKPRPVYNLAVVHFRQGGLSEAVAGFQAVLRLEPENVDALCQLGDIHRDEGENRAAMEMYLRAQRIKPHSHVILNKICYLWIQDGQYERAFEQLARVPDASKDVNYYLNYAIYFSRTGQLEQARSTYQHILRLDPHNAVAWTNLGNLCRRSGDPLAAEGCYLKALSIEPDYYLAHFNLGRLCLEEGRIEEALAQLEAARRSNPRFAEADFETGNVLASSRRYAQAEEYYRRFLAARPDHAEAWYRLGMVLLELNRPEEAAGCFQRVLKLSPDHPHRDEIAPWVKTK